MLWLEQEVRKMKRRKFIQKSSLVSLGFLGLQTYADDFDFADGRVTSLDDAFAYGYGSLKKDPKGVMELPEGFSYKIISTKGNEMSDGLMVPGRADGMGSFQGPQPHQTIVIRNHEVSPTAIPNGVSGEARKLISKIPENKFYDFGFGSTPCCGGTTTFIYNHKTQEIEKEWMSLMGTVRNCAGGITPWGTWITCEESVLSANNKLEKNHGYNFEVPASDEIALYDPIPLKAMGRFNHEAVCVDPRTGIVYQTEDRPDGMFYRFIPNVWGQLREGGRLQILAIEDKPTFDTRNWMTTLAKKIKKGKPFKVRWVDIDDVESKFDDLRKRGAKLGGAKFARAEGIWFGDGEIYFACTNGGRQAIGQIFRYTPSAFEGEENEKDEPGILELFLEPNRARVVENCDNLTIGANGDLVICEDKFEPRIIGVTPEGKTYKIAKNVGYKSEFAGATFSPDGQVLFVNIQIPGLTLAITGPWENRES